MANRTMLFTRTMTHKSQKLFSNTPQAAKTHRSNSDNKTQTTQDPSVLTVNA